MNTQVLLPPVPRVGILFDAQNLYCASKQGYGRLDYRVALRAALRNRILHVAKAYVVTHPKFPLASHELTSTLMRAGIHCYTKECELNRQGNPIKANLDIELAIDATQLLLSKDMHTLVIASGDGDFKPLIDLGHSLGKKIEIMGYRKLISRHLIESADKVTYLDSNYFSIKKAA